MSGGNSSCSIRFASLLQTDSEEKKPRRAGGLPCQHPWQTQMPESRGLGGARGSDATTLWLWVSQEESVLLQPGHGWLQGCRPAPCPKAAAKGAAGDPLLCIHRLLFTLLCAQPSGTHNGPRQAKSALALGFPPPVAPAYKLPGLQTPVSFCLDPVGSSYSIDFICIAGI